VEREQKEIASRRRFLFSLMVAVFATVIIDVLVPLQLSEIAQTFHVSVGTAGQLSAINSFAALAVAIIMGALSVRIKHKNLLTFGVLLIIVCSVGLYLAPNFLFMELLYPLNGIGSAMVGISASTMVGDFFPMNKKAKALGWLLATGSIATVISAPVTSMISTISGWKSVLITFMLPLSLVSLIMILIAIPSKPSEPQLSIQREPFLSGFRKVFANISATVCLTSSFLIAAFIGGGTFGYAFLEETFNVSSNTRGILMLLVAAFLAVGGVSGGSIVNRFGRKHMAILNGFLACLLSTLSYFIPNLSIIFALRIISATFGGIALTAGTALSIDQIPQFRGTMLSMGRVFQGIGGTLGVLVGGMVLNLFNYQMTALVIGLIGISASPLLIFLAKDPTKQDNLLRHSFTSSTNY
jgi:predicted MFS family arabinose efflux permease